MLLLFMSCASAPQPIQLDGADRVSINDAATIQTLKRKASESHEASTERQSLAPEASSGHRFAGQDK